MENPPALSSSPPSVNSALPAPTDASLAALLAFNADIPFPSQAADVVNLAELVPLCTALQLRAEVSPPFRLTHVAPHAPALLKCLAFWLASFPDADNVVGVVTVLTYVVSLCPSGATEIIRATMPAADEEDMAAAGAAATASAADALTVPRFRLFLPRLLYSVSRTSGREAPYNALISGARAGSLLAALAFSLGEVSARWATAPPPARPFRRCCSAFAPRCCTRLPFPPRRAWWPLTARALRRRTPSRAPCPRPWRRRRRCRA